MLRLTFVFSLNLAVIAGCGQTPAKNAPGDRPIAQLDGKLQINADRPDNPNTDKANGGQPGDDKKGDPAGDAGKLPDPAFFTADEKQEKYDAALNDALEMLAQHKLPEALVAMEAARGFIDNDFIKGEIAKVRQRLDQDNAAKTTVGNIETVLAEGKAAEAAKLAGDALKEFGGSNDAQALIKLRIQADALAGVQKKGETDEARFKRFRDEGEAALNEKNLRAAALAFEQAVLAREDAPLQQKLEGIRANLEKYDALRAKAAELRKDPSQLEDAIASLQAAQAAWDTLQVRLDLDEFTLALQKRRDTISVADFELRADVGVADLGRTVAEELLPLFKNRFDLVERGQIGKVVAELKLENGLDEPANQRQLGKLAKVRYLVLGSVAPLGGIAVHARLVDAQTGVVVQTGKVVGANAEAVVALLPDLARQLTMADDEKMEFDAAQEKRLAKAPLLIENAAPLPPPPPPALGPQPAVAADAVQVAPPPAFGNLAVNAFQALPPPPAAGIVIAPAADVIGVQFRHRLLVAALHRGDFFLGIGNFAEAQRQFNFALNLAPGNADILLRIDRVRPFVAPPVVVVQQPVIIDRPRVAVLNFLVAGDPRVVPPTLSGYVPSQLAPYLAASFDIVDPGLVYWYMGSLGLTVNDLLVNPEARLWLGRAVGVRYFLLGTIQQTGSFDVSTYLLDSEFGFLQGTGRVHVRNTFEMRLRMGELAQLTLMSPAERQAFLAQAQAQAYEAAIFKGRVAMQEQRFPVAVQFFNDALQIRPGSPEALFYLADADRLARVQALQQRRVQLLIGPGFVVVDVQRRQWEIARAAEQARLAALAATAGYGEPERVLLLQQREQAQTVLVKQAQLSFRTKNFSFSVSVFESAVNLAPTPAVAVVAGVDPWRELAVARREASLQAQVIQTQVIAQQEAALRQQREQELIAARAQLAVQQKQLEGQRQARLQRDKQAYTKAMGEGQALLAKNDFAGAEGAFLVAQRLNKTAVVDNLLDLTAKNRALAQAKTDGERKVLEAKLDTEREKRKAAELEAKRNQDLYQQALQLAQAALAKKDYVTAQAKFEAAGAVFKSDVVLAGLKQVADGRVQQDAALNSQKLAVEKATRVKQMIADGQGQLKDKQFAAAVKTFQAAKQLAPDHLDVLAGLTQAEHARDGQLAQERKTADEANRLTGFQRLLKSGQANLAAKQYDAAVANLTEAVKLNPGDATAVAALKQAEKARAGTAPDPAAQKNLATYQKLIADGRFAMNGKRYEDAIKAFSDAQKVLPGDQAAKDFLADAQKGKKDAAAALALAAQKQADAQKKAQDFQKALTLGKSALAGRDFTGAAKAFAQAQQLDPTNPAVQQALRDLNLAQKAAAADTQKLQASFDAAVVAGQKSFAAKDYANAVASFSQAAKLIPTDTKVPALLKQAQQAWNDAKVSQGDLAKRQAQYDTALKLGQGALAKKDFDGAIKAFNDASKIMPGDAQAVKLLKQAQQAQLDFRQQEADAGLKAKLEQQRKTDFAALLKDATAKFNGKQFNDAKVQYQAALKLYPNDPTAQAGLRDALKALDDSKTPPKDNKALFQKAMQDGQRFLDVSRWTDAQREFEAALKIVPNDPTATKLLEKAKKKMK